MQCKDFILALITKIKANWPLNYSLVRNLQCLDPKVIATKPEDAIADFRRVLQSLVQSKKLNIRKRDVILNQFSEFTTSDAVGFKLVALTLSTMMHWDKKRNTSSCANIFAIIR